MLLAREACAVVNFLFIFCVNTCLNVNNFQLYYSSTNVWSAFMVNQHAKKALLSALQLLWPFKASFTMTARMKVFVVTWVLTVVLCGWYVLEECWHNYKGAQRDVFFFLSVHCQCPPHARARKLQSTLIWFRSFNRHHLQMSPITIDDGRHSCSQIAEVTVGTAGQQWKRCLCATYATGSTNEAPATLPRVSFPVWLLTVLTHHFGPPHLNQNRKKAFKVALLKILYSFHSEAPRYSF